MIAKNIALAEDLLERVRVQAESEGKTEDELMNEAALKLLETRHTLGELRSFVMRNRARADSMALEESDVHELIADVRRGQCDGSQPIRIFISRR